MTLNEAIDILARAGIDSPDWDAEELFCHFAGYGRSTLHLMHRIESDSPKLIEAVRRRANREPLQYITGRAYFYKERYNVTPDCLIPRFDTEILVDYAVSNLKPGAKFLDLCTGSGCVAISTLNSTTDTTAIGADISPATLEIARGNADYYDLTDRLTLLECDVLSSKIEGKFDAILSNPPYITNEAYKDLAGEIYFEPSLAFLGGDDGGVFYRSLTKTYRDSLVDGGFIAYEIGYDQATLISEIAESNNMSCEIIKDYSGNDRVAILKVKD